MPTADDATDWLRKYQQQRERERQAAKQTFADMCDRLGELGIQTVDIEYDGYGDSGTVDEVTAYADGEQIELPDDYHDEITAATECLLPDGWENNDGAFGKVVLSVDKRCLTREHNWRVEATEYDEETWNL